MKRLRHILTRENIMGRNRRTSLERWPGITRESTQIEKEAECIGRTKDNGRTQG